jgi:redox-sensing transcriptional repressor
MTSSQNYLFALKAEKLYIDCEIIHEVDVKELSIPAIQRLCSLFQILKGLHHDRRKTVSSSELGDFLNTTAHTIRKDISALGVPGNSGAGYDVQTLMELIGTSFNFFNRKKACIIGLGKLGTSLLHHPDFGNGEFDIVAGFDSNVNRIETISSSVPLFPVCQLKEAVQKMSIEYALCAVPAHAARETVEKLEECGIKGIINFAPVVIRLKNKTIVIRNVDITGELRILTAIAALRAGSSQQH